MTEFNEQTRLLRKKGLKLTRPRAKILEIFEKTERKHLSVEDVFFMLNKQGNEVPLGTIYRVLTQFEEAGIIARQNFDNGHAVFELKNDNHHDHMVCVRCGRVQEFYDEEIEKLQRTVAKNKGFEVIEHSHVIYGICDNPQCREGKEGGGLGQEKKFIKRK